MKARRDAKGYADGTEHRLWRFPDETSGQQRTEQRAQTTSHIQDAHAHSAGLEDALSKQREQDQEATAHTGAPSFHRQQAQHVHTRAHIAYAVPKILPAIARAAAGGRSRGW